MVHASEIPVKTSQNHQEEVNGLSFKECTRVIPYVAHIIKHKSIGSKRIYRFNVSKPTSEIIE